MDTPRPGRFARAVLSIATWGALGGCAARRDGAAALASVGAAALGPPIEVTWSERPIGGGALEWVVVVRPGPDGGAWLARNALAMRVDDGGTERGLIEAGGAWYRRGVGVLGRQVTLSWRAAGGEMGFTASSRDAPEPAPPSFVSTPVGSPVRAAVPIQGRRRPE